VRITDDIHEAVSQAEILVMLVNHRPYHEIQRGELDGKILIDTRGVWS
jgi:UDP-N-acetyl-D-mannosaminuronic acid dehydrogenase